MLEHAALRNPKIIEAKTQALPDPNMADDTVEMKIRCLCGECKFSKPVSLKPLEAWFCTCKGCRHVTGNLFFLDIYWGLPMPQNPSLKMFIFSPMAWVYFCSTCGTCMFWFDHHTQGLYTSSGTIEEPEKLNIRYLGWAWLGSTGDGGPSDWLTKINGHALTRWRRTRLYSEQVAEGWNIGQFPPEWPREETVRGHCHCQGVDFRITRPKDQYNEEERCGLDSVASPAPWLNPKGDKFVAGLCACRTCRLASGQDLFHWAFIPKANLTSPDGKPFKLDSGTLKWYRSSEDVKRYFCGRCGATAFWDCDERPALIDVAVGLLHSPSGARAEGWLEYRTDGITHKKDAVNGPLIEAFDEGYQTWLKTKGKQVEAS